MTTVTDTALIDSEERMYREIYDAIMEHRLPARTKLTEQSLSQIYGLARHGVRKVLGRLSADGLVDLEANRGAFIASPGVQEANDMFELRQTLEQMAIEKALAAAKPADIRALRSLVERERDAYQSGDRPQWIRLSADFHIALAQLSGNQLLVGMLRRLVSRTTLLISNQATSANVGSQACSFDEHLNVVNALERKDKKLALQEMSLHLNRCACRTPKAAEKNFDLRAALAKTSAKSS
ncbi:GntR family transcriptional regulator [Undibacterium sp. Jales W-56]|uniref:GntR family transcriptional regulator n=1 Tax=Undibacterium sp. Jales W-56 TaxID=2897325 RepID=UPI0021CFC526|nr:GntR family transcriptional regulator [Undibacterium sp. Jales W-56]MCU6434871.1 GntR family transcriptional regulator [Undibacterium sp. Jales W-56]